MESAIYKGKVRHRRFEPVGHEFVYSVFMIWLDLDEFQDVFSKSKLWSCDGLFSFVQFRRKDFFDGSDKPLKSSLLDWVYEQTGRRLSGPVRMLANLRIGGHLINPIVCYYLYSQNGQNLEYVVAEVTNTPWGQRQHYLLPCTHTVISKSKTAKPEAANLEVNEDENKEESLISQSGQKKMLKGEFAKAMHVSPFHPMDMKYKWKLDEPSEHLNLHLDNIKNDKKVFDASLMLKRENLTARSMRNVVWQYPLMTLKVAFAIYCQAFKLWRKGVPFYSNPHSNSQ